MTANIAFPSRAPMTQDAENFVADFNPAVQSPSDCEGRPFVIVGDSATNSETFVEIQDAIEADEDAYPNWVHYLNWSNAPVVAGWWTVCCDAHTGTLGDMIICRACNRQDPELHWVE